MRRAKSIYLLLITAVLLLSALIFSLLFFPLGSILVILISVVLAKVLIRRKHLTFIDEEYSPDIPVEEYPKARETE